MPRLAKYLNKHIPKSLETSIRAGSFEKAEKLLSSATQNIIDKASLPINNVKLLAPLANPPKIICLGLNYGDHAAEQNAQVPDEPVIFFKPRTAIIGPNENIIKPKFVKQLDYEAELAIVIGKKAKNVSVSEAENYILP